MAEAAAPVASPADASPTSSPSRPRSRTFKSVALRVVQEKPLEMAPPLLGPALLAALQQSRATTHGYIDSKLDEGLPMGTSQYLATYANESYPRIVQDLQDKKASASSIYDAMCQLCFFSADPSLLQTLINLISNDPDDKHHRPTMRLAHYVITRLANHALADIDQSMRVLLKQVNHEVLHRRVIALKTLARLAPDDVAKTDLLETLRGLLGAVEALKGKSAKLSNKGKRHVTEMERTCLQYAVLSAIRQRPLVLLPSLVSHVNGAVDSADPVAARHALALLAQYHRGEVGGSASAEERLQVAQVCLNAKGINLRDSLSQVYRVQLCANLASSESLDEGVRTQLGGAVSTCLNPQNPRVFLEAVKMYLDPKADQQLWRAHVPEIVSGLSKLLCSSSFPLLHCTARVVGKLACASVADAAEEPLSVISATLYPQILDHLVGRKPVQCPFVRSQLLQALVWLVSTQDAEQLAKLRAAIGEEIARKDCSAPLAHALLGVACKRLEATPSAPVAHWLLGLLDAWVLTQPAKLDLEATFVGWQLIGATDSSCQPALLRSLLRVVDAASACGSASEDSAAFAHLGELGVRLSIRLELVALEFLGLHAVVLCEQEREEGGADAASNPMGDVLLRLQHAATFGCWQVRVVCVRALIKIAMLSDDTVRLHVYEYLLAISKLPALGLQLVVLPMLQLLDRMFEGRAKMLQLSASGGGSENEAALLRDLHAALSSQVALFCDMPPDWSPLGSEYGRQ